MKLTTINYDHFLHIFMQIAINTIFTDKITFICFGIKNTQFGTILRFTGKNAHAIMVMLKNVPTTTYPFHENTSACCRCFFMPLAGNQKRLPAF